MKGYDVGCLGFCTGSKTPREINDLLNLHIVSIVATPVHTTGVRTIEDATKRAPIRIVMTSYR